MCVPDMTLYSLIPPLIYALYGSAHRASILSTSRLVWALLLCQSLHPADLARSLPHLRTAHARQALRHVRRIIGRSHLSSECLTEFLVRAALRIVSDAEVMLILDTTRCIRWEIFTLGVMFHGRVLPVAWAILPYPWPRGKFTPTVISLVNRTLACWPNDRPVHLLADRAFPSLKLFRALTNWRNKLPLGYTIRLRAGDWVRLQSGQSVKIADLITGIPTDAWSSCPASYQQRQKFGEVVLLVFGRATPTYPAHQIGASDQARRLARGKRRRAHLLSKGQANAPNTDTTWVLFSTAPDCSQAIKNYSRRFSTEGTYRDLKSWDLQIVAGRETDISHVDGLVGLAVLGYFVQAVIGAVAGRASEKQSRARQEQWTTTDRVSIFWRGRQVLHDRAFDWRFWLKTAIPELISQINPEKIFRKQTSIPPIAEHCQEAA